MPRKPFYAQGIRFECQGSGKCCTSRGSYGYVYLTLEDQRRMAQYFELPLGKFLKKYCKMHLGHVALRDPVELGMLQHPQGDCVFLEGGSRCGIYEARPEHCRTWPFWPENMKPRAWSQDVATFCPGVGKGKLYTYEEIKAILAPQGG